MNHMSYIKVGRRCHGARGFRLNPKRFSVQKLRVRFVYFFRLLSRWRQSIKRGMSRNSCIKRNGSSRRSLVMDVSSSNMGRGHECKLRSFGRSNSFYSEAIADCLEFIKRSSLSVEQKQDSPR